MAIPTRFNTLFVRQSSIVEKYSGGLKAFVQDFWSPRISAQHFVADDHLIAWFSMGGELVDEMASLEDRGLIHEHDSQAIDMATADQVDGIAPICDWLDQKTMEDGFMACWLKGELPGYIVDKKPGAFLRRARKSKCPSCLAHLGAGPVSKAIDEREFSTGPLGGAWFEKIDPSTTYIVTCDECKKDLRFDVSGHLLGKL